MIATTSPLASHTNVAFSVYVQRSKPSYCKPSQDMIGMICILAKQLAGVDKCCTAI